MSMQSRGTASGPVQRPIWSPRRNRTSAAARHAAHGPTIGSEPSGALPSCVRGAAHMRSRATLASRMTGLYRVRSANCWPVFVFGHGVRAAAQHGAEAACASKATG